MGLVRALGRLRGDFSARANSERSHLLRALGRRRFLSAHQLTALHDELLFLAAFPPDRALSAAARFALSSFAERVRNLTRQQATRLNDSGIAGTTSTHTFMFGVARWLLTHREAAIPVWRHQREAERLDPLIRLSMLPAEMDAFDDSGLSTRDWLELVSKRLPGGILHWLVGTRPPPAHATWREWYDHADVPLAWTLGNSRWSTSRNVSAKAPATSRSAFRRLPGDPVGFISSPLPHIRRLRADEARPWVDASVAALTARCREVAPTAYANLNEVYLADLGEGVQLCVIGADRDNRLALEANYGYTMFSNGVPIGYGGVTPLANQANTGANIFEAFRGSEAPFVFAQSLRAFRALFGIDRFVVNPFQFGAGNHEAIQSGAYWFYDRLGFRPVDQTTRTIADVERRRLAKAPGRRSTSRVLRLLAKSDLMLELPETSPVPLFAERWLSDLGQMVAATLSGVPAADRCAYVYEMARTQKRRLTGEPAPLTPVERRGAVLLSPIIHLLTASIARWDPQDRLALWGLVPAKGALQERTFVRVARSHRAFWDAIAARCRRGPG